LEGDDCDDDKDLIGSAADDDVAAPALLLLLLLSGVEGEEAEGGEGEATAACKRRIPSRGSETGSGSLGGAEGDLERLAGLADEDDLARGMRREAGEEGSAFGFSKKTVHPFNSSSSLFVVEADNHGYLEGDMSFATTKCCCRALLVISEIDGDFCDLMQRVAHNS